MTLRKTKRPKIDALKLSARAKTAAKAIKRYKVRKTPSKLKGKRSQAIKMAVRAYYVG